ncbi:MAG: endonuclease/exonuclease/phosphatase family protein [Thermoplasmata archaeon]
MAGRAELVANRHLLLSLLAALLFIQSLRAFFSSVYYNNLVALSINASVLYTLLLFAPAVYLLPQLRRQLPIVMVVAAVLLAAFRLAMNIAWGTALYLPLSGLATASFLVLFPAMLQASRQVSTKGGWLPVALGLVLAFALDSAISLLGASRDPSTGLSGLYLTLPAAAFVVYLSVVSRPSAQIEGDEKVPRRKTALLGLGLGAWLFLEYAILANAHIVARWNSLPLAAAAFATILGLLVPAASTVKPLSPLDRPWPLWSVNAVAFLALLDYSIMHSVLLPILLLFAQVAMVLNLFRILSALHAGGARRTAAALLYASLLFLLLLFTFAFTLTYAYVPLRPLWEGKETFLMLAAFLLVLLPVVITSRGFQVRPRIPPLPRGLLVALLTLPLLLAAISLGSAPTLREPSPGPTLSVLTYNVHQGFNNDGVVDPEVFVEVLQTADADIVALQESDTVRFTSANLDLVNYLAMRLGYHSFYGPPTREQSFGIALLSRYVILEATYFVLSSTEDKRSLLRARIQVEGADVWIFVVHLGLETEDRGVQVEEILEEASQVRGHRILAGDFNSCPGGRCPRYSGPADTVYERVSTFYGDVWVEAGFERDDPEGFTYSALEPFERIDYIFVSPGLRVLQAERVMTEATGRASDHLPVLASLEVIT